MSAADVRWCKRAAAARGLRLREFLASSADPRAVSVAASRGIGPHGGAEPKPNARILGVVEARERRRDQARARREQAAGQADRTVTVSRVTEPVRHSL